MLSGPELKGAEGRLGHGPGSDPVSPGRAPGNPSGSLGFALFVVLNGVLFLRPADLIEWMNGWPVYEVAILANLIVLAPKLLSQLRSTALVSRPISLCVLGLVAAVALSCLSSSEFEQAPAATYTFFKVALSYLLMVAAVDTVARLRAYLLWLSLWLVVLTTLALLQYHEVIDMPALRPDTERQDDKITETGELLTGVVIRRLCGVGIFGNPNDLSRILVVGIALAVYFVTSTRGTLLRLMWCVPIPVYGYALAMTHSRGGLLTFLATSLVLIQQRLGGAKGLVLGGLGVIALFSLFQGGRQTDLSTEGGTGQQRIRLWSDGFQAVRSSPAFGAGFGRYAELTGGLGAHNSFVHAYVETGFFGGTLFFGAFYFALTMLARRRVPGGQVLDRHLEPLRVTIFAVVAGYVVGMWSSSRCYAIPTYFLLGLAAVYLGLASRKVKIPAFRLSPRLAFQLAAASAAAVLLIQVFILTSVNWGSK